MNCFAMMRMQMDEQEQRIIEARLRALVVRC